uniref:Family with sequence similarity 171 member A2a n=1 Tax=Astyanax mexicanus TaxID=7994 RepID=A0A8B9HDC2_ASTMX
ISQPWVQLQRKAIRPALNTSHITLSAMLTSTRSQYELGGFPYPLGLEVNSTGSNGSWVELTAVAAVCARLTGPNGTEVEVSDPIHVSVPLPSDSPLKTATSVPVWRFEERAGLWVRSGTGYIKSDDSQMTWSFVAPHLGYWLAAFPSSVGESCFFYFCFLTFLNAPNRGGRSTILRVIPQNGLCFFLFRRRCLKPRQHHRKMHMSSTLDSSKRDQGTSTSQLNLISSAHMETASSIGDHDGVKSDLSSTRDLQSSREDFFRHGPGPKSRHPNKGSVNSKRAESFPLQATRSTNTNNLDLLLQDDMARSYNPPSPPPLLPAFAGLYHSRDSMPPDYSSSQAADHLNTQPGQLIFCHSMEQMKESMYRSVVPTLVIPAHYMRLSSDLSAVEQAMERQQQLQHDMEGIQVSMTLPRQQSQQQQQQQQQQSTMPQKEDDKAEQKGEQTSQEQNWASEASSSGPVHIPVLFDDSTMAQVNGELKALTEKKLLELGVKPHPLAWFVSLDGRSNSLVRHSYIELGNEAFRPTAQEHRAETYPGISGKLSQRKGKEESKIKEGGERKAHGKIYSKLPVIDTTDPSSSSESHTATYSPEDSSMAPLLEEAPECSRGGTFPRRGRSRDNSACSSGTEVHRDSVTSPDDDDNDDKDEDGENKKSPWQRREERPLMVFNVK